MCQTPLEQPTRFLCDPYRGLLCIYGLAKDLVSHMELRLDGENIPVFVGIGTAE